MPQRVLLKIKSIKKKRAIKLEKELEETKAS